MKTTFKILCWTCFCNSVKFAIRNSQILYMHGLVFFRQIKNLLLTMLTPTMQTVVIDFFPAAKPVLDPFKKKKKIFVSKVPPGGERQVECTYPSSCRTGTKPSVWMTHWPADCCSFCVSLLSEMPWSRRSSPKFPATAWWPWAAAWDISISRLLLFSRYMMSSVGWPVVGGKLIKLPFQNLLQQQKRPWV